MIDTMTAEDPFQRNDLLSGPAKWSPVFFMFCLLFVPATFAGKKGVDAIRVPEGFSVELAAGPELAPYPMIATLDGNGKLYIAESSGLDISGADMAENPECRIRILEDANGDGFYDKGWIFADRLSLPMGVLCYRGDVYVAAPPDFLRLRDSDGDGVADVREVILTGWNVFNTASLHGPFLGPDGWLYLTHGRHGYSIRTKEGYVLEGLAARIWRCRPDGTNLERVCGGGFDNPVEIVFTPDGEMIGTMTYFTDPRNGQRDALDHWVLGGVYPKPHPALSEFVRTGDLLPQVTRFARIAPSGLMRYRGTVFGVEYEGNLFSAQFNTHRLQRHIVERYGSTFRTKDIDFLISEDPDFHPTDVLEDADGSLILLDTGGWYVNACPLSRVAKPEIRGGIYRVRRVGGARRMDPYGGKIDFEKLSPEETVSFLADPRPFVRDKAFQRVVQLGESSVAGLQALLGPSSTPEVRCSAVWALMQIGTAAAREGVRETLSDPSPLVRAAAAKACGRGGDADAAESLSRLLQDEDPTVRRSAMEALGEIGVVSAVPALLRASTATVVSVSMAVPIPSAPAVSATAQKFRIVSTTQEDPFIEHSWIYALICLRDSENLLKSLEDPSRRVRKAALIALDQIGDGALRKEHLIPFLDDADESLRRAALGVAAHHPEWSGVVLEFLRGKLLEPSLDKKEAEAVREALLAFCADPHVQTLVAEMLAESPDSASRQLLLLDTLDRCSLKEFPTSWMEALGNLIAGAADDEVRWRAVNLVSSRGIDRLDSELMKVAENADEPAELRVAVLAAVVSRKPALSQDHLDFLLEQCDPEADPTLRLSAAQVLSRADLSPSQLVRLAEGPLDAADALTLPLLVRAFGDSSDPRVGKSLVEALIRSAVGPNVLGGKALEDLLAKFPESVRNSAAPLLEEIEKEKAARLERIRELEPLLKGGDVGRGRQVFFGRKTACSSCHAIGNEGGHLGPDLTAIGKIRSGRDILESIVFPSASFVPGYEPMRVETEDDLFTGIVGRQTPDAMVLKTGADAEVLIYRDEIVSMVPSSVSLMPEGLDKTVTQSELIDLLAFLQAQNGNQWLLPEVALKQE